MGRALRAFIPWRRSSSERIGTRLGTAARWVEGSGALNFLAKGLPGERGGSGDWRSDLRKLFTDLGAWNRIRSDHGRSRTRDRSGGRCAWQSVANDRWDRPVRSSPQTPHLAWGHALAEVRASRALTARSVQNAFCVTAYWVECCRCRHDVVDG